MRSLRPASILLTSILAFCTCAPTVNKGAPVIPPDGWVVRSPSGVVTVQVRGCSLGGTANYPTEPRLYYRVTLGDTEMVRWSPLGITRQDADFTDDLRYLGESQRQVTDDYILPRGKRSHFRNTGLEKTLSFQTPQKVRMDLVVRAYDDGLAFCYHFPEISAAQFVVTGETTGFRFAPGTRATLLPQYAPGTSQSLGEWMTDLPAGTAAPAGAGWALPALFSSADGARWALLAESGLAAGNAVFGLAGKTDDEIYRFRFPHPDEEAGRGDVQPHSTLPLATPWATPWRVMILSARLAGIVESSLATDLGEPDLVGAGDWVRPGNLVIGEAAGKRVELPDAPGDVAALPLVEFSVGGLMGVRVAVSASGKPDVVSSLLGLLEETKRRHLLVEFEGRIPGAGWDRTFPNLLSGTTWRSGSIDGARQARQNLFDPFTRNVVAPMQPMPVAFVEQARRSPMTWGHELGLTVVFESGLRRFVDDGPNQVADLLLDLPSAWDETRLLDGVPGHTVIIARRKDRIWYVGGLNGDATAKTRAVPLELLGTGTFNMALLADGLGETDLVLTQRQRNATDVQGIKMAPYGGFLMRLVPEH